jgi:hypothetical protein
VIRRRTWLRLGVVSTVVLAAAGAGVVLTTPPGFAQGNLSAGAGEACKAIARAVLDGRLPTDRARLQAELDAYLQRLEAVIAGFPSAVQAEISELLTLLSTTPGRVGLMGVLRPWPSAGVDDIQVGLASMRRSSLSLKLQAYHALRDLTHAAWYADETRWSELGYPGPTAL